ncbi:hypothetical protein ACRE_040030 [Hapsidospora chrysogenum ATCC 11550]|uniref:CCHC-type domain-containing protein n=1 Tax=Hapsidospora chrysogenum (strain ATCC 11550 / CBS 779.69 / DSM 880 / IAM 14645 / JCM 23072 / IMI 49137) TaxID=857340 RepID=A0A086T763_HAPC1|nr:hypothetical protein ACRE_040030 [Hapsidospora chrysogenum ATCC 11550]
MADTSGGYGLRPDEPQCYNCGTMGHWAVACPEPTRQTPASQGQNVPKPSPSRQDNPEEEGTRADGDREMSAPRSEQTRESGETRVTPDKAQTSEREPEQVKEQAPTKADANDNFESPWEADAIFAEPEPTHPPDEVGRPLPSTYTEDVVLPRKWDSKCIESEYFNPDNLEEFTRPIHETKYWQDMEFDPAFVRGGKFPNGELLRDFRWENGNPEQETAVQKRPKDDDHQRNESPAQGRRGSHDGSLKRKRSPDTPPASSRGRKYRDSPSRERRHSNGRRDRRLSETYRPDASRYDDRPRGRSTLRDSEPRRRPSPDSRSISPASSRSSGLDSLDRELLGIETKDKDQLEEGRSRQETEKASKPKRRRVQLDSAYR